MATRSCLPCKNTGLSAAQLVGRDGVPRIDAPCPDKPELANPILWQVDGKSHNVGIQVEWLLTKVFAYCGLRLVKNYVFDDDATLTRPNPYFGDMYYMTNTPNQKYRPYYGGRRRR